MKPLLTTLSADSNDLANNEAGQYFLDIEDGLKTFDQSLPRITFPASIKQDAATLVQVTNAMVALDSKINAEVQSQPTEQDGTDWDNLTTKWKSADTKLRSDLGLPPSWYDQA